MRVSSQCRSCFPQFPVLPVYLGGVGQQSGSNKDKKIHSSSKAFVRPQENISCGYLEGSEGAAAEPHRPPVDKPGFEGGPG